ncbi:gustatory receptor for bitter taste 22e [Drosophila guanche]|uniref:Gustatory receptor n=1 Tax=Drosophila guanche TaxID=7266 RepID=A0A3B0JF95_DROGU|nr:gustatory receptor for bitter taste 22e [Drosophila guanche]SPP79353.1 blast:Gustatory receptor for bitter taste 22e [Drosophila guanche]
MFCCSGGFRQKLVHVTLRGALYTSWILGLFPFTYDMWTRKLHRSKWLIGYGIVLNVAIVTLIQANDTEAEKTVRMEVFQRNPLAEQINSVHDFLNVSLVVLMLLRCYWRSGDIAKILNELMDLQWCHFRHYSLNDCCKFDDFVLHKCLSVGLELCSMLVMQLGMYPKYSLQLFLGFIGLSAIVLVVLMGALHFHLVVVYIYRCVWMVNRELLRFANQLAEGETVDPAGVDRLLGLYSRLLELNHRLAEIYDYQMVLVMVSFLATNVLGIYYYIIFSISLHKDMDIILLFIVPQALFINMYDFWLSIAVCDLAERTGRKTSTILKLFNDIEYLDVSLGRSISDFALFCSHQRLRFRHCGLFYVNYEMGFRMAITSFLYLLFLIQFDFNNL